MATVERLTTALRLHEPVVLTNDVWNVKSGARGYIVDAYPERNSYTVEFFTDEGEEIAVIPLEAEYLRPASDLF